MKRLVDIVNFNCDASCLTSSSWLAALRGGRESSVYRWVHLYVRHRRKVVLGFTGGALADMRAFNPEALALINDHPDLFGTIARPFAHDIHLLRRPASFAFNVRLGLRAQASTLPRLLAPTCYLPPEFMLSGEQASVLAGMGMSAVLINAARFVTDKQHRIPTTPYLLRGLFGTRIGCLPINGDLTLKYLHAMQGYDSKLWQEAVSAAAGDTVLLWRDGESCFLLPDGVAREEHWLMHEGPAIERCTLSDWTPTFASVSEDDQVVDHFPVHSFAAWMKEFRMLGFLGRLAELEDSAMHGSTQEAALWLSLINSDVLSAVEKRPVRVALRRSPGVDVWEECVLHRSRREFEAEEFLALIGRLRTGEDVWPLVAASQDAHMRKLDARAQLLHELLEGS
jgi:hypothetical protein